MGFAQVPKIEKVVVNCGMGDADQISKGLEAALKDLAVITGQRPVKTKARQSIATFKLKEGDTVGIAVTLRGNVSSFPLLSFFSLSLYDFLLSRFFILICAGFDFQLCVWE